MLLTSLHLHNRSLSSVIDALMCYVVLQRQVRHSRFNSLPVTFANLSYSKDPCWWCFICVNILQACAKSQISYGVARDIIVPVSVCMRVYMCGHVWTCVDGLNMSRL